MTWIEKMLLAPASRVNRRAPALPDGGYARSWAALRRRTQVEMLRSLSLRAYLAATALQHRAADLRNREDGQAMVEYALLLSLIAVVSIAVLTALGHSVSKIFSSINSAL
jgi:pilus assembly protein Flp/PilA